MSDTHDLWVFAYGSLMWRPCFLWAECRPARLGGYRRSLCIYSVHHRGTLSRPGLVLGLDRGGVCEGLAYRVPSFAASDARRALAARELIYGVYRELFLPVWTHGENGPIEMVAMAYVAEPCHPAYAGRLPPRIKAGVVRGAAGEAGTNLDYLANTLKELTRLGIRDRRLERVACMAGAFALGGEANGATRQRARGLQRAWARRARSDDIPAVALDQPNRFGFRSRRT